MSSSHIIEAKDKCLAKIFLNERYKIDVFQREYRWQRKHIEALINDLTISFLNSYRSGDTIEKYDSYESYYMGPIVLCNDNGSLSIVDGQQRLTSFTLLLIFLHHLQSKHDLPPNLVKDFRQFLYITKGGRTTLVLDIDTREKIINHLYEKPDEIYEHVIKDESVENIINRYQDITKLFPEEINQPEILPLFIEWLLDKVVVVEVKAFSMENAYTIFETMNDRGMNLSPTEMLKGYLLSKVSDTEKSYELNEFWKQRVADLKKTAGTEADLEFFRAWLRGKYAESIRSTRQGAENEDFEIIGTQFHAWIKKNSAKAGLHSPEDYYFFLQSDFDYFSSVYQKGFETRNVPPTLFEELYISNFFTIAESLAYPLFLSPVKKLDDEEVVNEKIKLVGKFVDVYTNVRSLTGRAITQSSIRYSMYELVKAIRNSDLQDLRERLSNELEKSLSDMSALTLLQRMDNGGYYHYFFARILFRLQNKNQDFSELLRNRKQSSYILCRIFNENEKEADVDEHIWQIHINSVAGYCLIRRWDLDAVLSQPAQGRIRYLIAEGYLPEIEGMVAKDDTIISMIGLRDVVLRSHVNEIWNF